MILLIGFLAFFIAIFLLVIIHEGGHFFAAKIAGIKVERFSIGFGKPLYKKQTKSGTEFAIAPILIGGYVKLNDDSYKTKSVWQKTMVMAAGVVANILLGFMIFWIMFTVGVETPKPIIGEIVPSSIADLAGLKPNEEITNIDGQPVHDWQKINMLVIKRLGDKDVITINNHSLALANWQINSLNPDPLLSLGIKPYERPMPVVINKISHHSPAEKIGLTINDHIIAINQTPVGNWKDFVIYLKDKPNAMVTFTIIREHRQLQLQGQIGSKISINLKRAGYLGISPIIPEWPKSLLTKEKYPFFFASYPAWQQTYSLLAFNFIILEKMLTGKISLQVLGGPITIFNAANLAFREGLLIYVSFLALFSIMLAFVNILPIPSLDGGGLVFLLIEGLTTKVIPEKIQTIALKIGMLLLVIIIFIALGNDLLRLFS